MPDDERVRILLLLNGLTIAEAAEALRALCQDHGSDGRLSFETWRGVEALYAIWPQSGRDGATPLTAEEYLRRGLEGNLNAP